jgi:hypothetical protein
VFPIRYFEDVRVHLHVYLTFLLLMIAHEEDRNENRGYKCELAVTHSAVSIGGVSLATHSMLAIGRKKFMAITPPPFCRNHLDKQINDLMESPWHKNYPAPRSNPIRLTHSEVANLIRDPNKKAGQDYILVDVRRVDFAAPTLFLTLANRL